MKTILGCLLCLPCLAVRPAAGAEETLLKGEVDHGGFGGPVAQWTLIDRDSALLVGGRGGWIIDHTFILGGAGHGLVTRPTHQTSLGRRRMEFGYGGVELGLVLLSERLVHIYLHALVGGGQVGLRDESMHDRDNDPMDGLHDAVFAGDAGIDAEMNVTSWFRVTLGAGYRLIRDTELETVTNADLSGPQASLMLKFGSF